MKSLEGRYRLPAEPGAQIGLRGRAMDGALAVFGSRLVLTVIQMVSTIALARLLTPDDFGLVGIIAPVAALISLFADAGLSTAALQAKEIAHEQASGLFWANVALGLVSALVLGASGPLMAQFYGRPELGAIAPAYAGSLLISSLSTQHMALLRRQMAFRRVAFIGVSAAFGSAAVAIILAWLRWGYWALVTMAYANAVVNLALAWYALKWLPGPPARNVGLRKMMRFGGYVAGGNLMYLVSENMVPMIIGRTSGATDVGLFGRASRLAEQFIDQVSAPLSQVALPVLSKLQDEMPRLKEAIYQILEKVTVLTFALAGLLVVSGSDVVVLLLGISWQKAGVAVQLLAVGALVWPVSRLFASAMIGLGHSRAMFSWSWLALAIRLLAVGIGTAWGLVGAAAAVAVSQWAGLIIFSFFISRYLPITLGDIVRRVRPMAFAAALAIGGTALTVTALNIDNVKLRLVMIVAEFVTLYLAGHAASTAGRRVMRDTLQFSREAISRRF